MDRGSQDRLQLERVQCGGYIVRQAYMGQTGGMEIFASTQIEDALNFMRDAMKPVQTGPGRS